MEVLLERGRGVARVGPKAAIRLSPTYPAQETPGGHWRGHQHACGRAFGQCALRSHWAAEVAV